MLDLFGSFNTPVLLIIWRRPEQTIRVLNSLREVKPKVLYVACDGPNQERIGEVELVDQTRDLIKTNIDWDCIIYTNYSNINQGCRNGVSGAISWFFDNVERGIILEDDCLPNSDFYLFCEEMLERFKDDSRIFSISGNNFNFGRWKNIDDASYFFSRYNHWWGWATWRRAWKFYEFNPNDWSLNLDGRFLNTMFNDKNEISHWVKIFNDVFLENKYDTWDYVWRYCIWKQNGLSITPRVNLVTNIGHGVGATHCNTYSPELPVFSIGALVHPKVEYINKYDDSQLFYWHLGGYKYGLAYRIKSGYRRVIRAIVNRFGSFINIFIKTTV